MPLFSRLVHLAPLARLAGDACLGWLVMLSSGSRHDREPQASDR